MKMTLILNLILSSFLLFSCAKDNKSQPPVITPETGTGTETMVWSDEFDYSGLPDASKWSYDTDGNASGWGNNELQYYTSARLKNSEVKNGFLYINAIKEDFEGKKYTSARLVTRTKGDWLYGRMEIKPNSLTDAVCGRQYGCFQPIGLMEIGLPAAKSISW